VDESPPLGIASIEALGLQGAEPLGHMIAARVRDAITSGRLGPGERIRQEELATHLGTSRIPVREALRQLENEGLVVLVPHSGARVARLDLAELTEVYRIREAIEPMVIAESAPNLTDQQIEHLAGLVDAIDAAADEPAKWLEIDRRFHLDCYAGASMSRVVPMIERFWNTTHHYRRAFITSLDRPHFDLVSLEHRLILDALERRDAVDSEERLRSHIRRTRQTLTAHAELFGS
jgi:DNA-binding GntR family transcriptional regulator